MLAPLKNRDADPAQNVANRSPTAFAIFFLLRFLCFIDLFKGHELIFSWDNAGKVGRNVELISGLNAF